MVTKISQVKVLDLDTYEVELGNTDFHVRKEGGQWVVDAFDSRVKDDTEAHIVSEGFKKNTEALDFIEDIAKQNSEDKLILDRKGIKKALKGPRTKRDKALETQFFGKSDKQLEQRLKELAEKGDREEFDQIVAELKRRNRARNKARKKDLPHVKRPRAKRASGASSGAPRKPRAKGSGSSKTSGWAKLKETMPTSAAARARLAEGGHSPYYQKVLENLVRYWEKRGK